MSMSVTGLLLAVFFFFFLNRSNNIRPVIVFVFVFALFWCTLCDASSLVFGFLTKKKKQSGASPHVTLAIQWFRAMKCVFTP